LVGRRPNLFGCPEPQSTRRHRAIARGPPAPREGSATLLLSVSGGGLSPPLIRLHGRGPALSSVFPRPPRPMEIRCCAGRSGAPVAVTSDPPSDFVESLSLSLSLFLSLHLSLSLSLSPPLPRTRLFHHLPHAWSKPATARNAWKCAQHSADAILSGERDIHKPRRTRYSQAPARDAQQARPRIALA